MSKEQLLQELADAFEQLIAAATLAAQRGVIRQGDTWGPREIVAHLAGWEVIATVRVPHIAAGMPPFEYADEMQQAVSDPLLPPIFLFIPIHLIERVLHRHIPDMI